MARTVYHFSGLASAGPVPVPGVRMGDTVIAVLKTSSDFSGGASSFLPFVLVDDQVQQTENDDLSAVTYAAVIER